MSLTVWQSPGCADLIADDLQEIVDRGGVVIDTGRIAESLGWNPTDPDRNMDLLRVALGMRTTAIKRPCSTYARHRIRQGIRHAAACAGRHLRPPVTNDRLRNGPAPDMFLMTWALQNRVVVSI